LAVQGEVTLTLPAACRTVSAIVCLCGDTTVDVECVQDGQIVYVLIEQDGIGGHTPTLSSKFKYPNGVEPSWTTTANAREALVLIGRGGNLYQCSFSKDVR
jgi:hypothetical protein